MWSWASQFTSSTPRTSSLCKTGGQYLPCRMAARIKRNYVTKPGLDRMWAFCQRWLLPLLLLLNFHWVTVYFSRDLWRDTSRLGKGQEEEWEALASHRAPHLPGGAQLPGVRGGTRESQEGGKRLCGPVPGHRLGSNLRSSAVGCPEESALLWLSG